MLNESILKDLITLKKYDEAIEYIINEFESILTTHIPEYTTSSSIDVSLHEPKLSGIMLNYSTILNDETTEEVRLARLMECYTALINTFEIQ